MERSFVHSRSHLTQPTLLHSINTPFGPCLLPTGSLRQVPIPILIFISLIIRSFLSVLFSAMHLVRMSRSSSFSRRRLRHLFDLPDEILRLILAYCCEDLDFLLWSCPLVAAEGQFCHDCYHCTLCHGPVSPSSLQSAPMSTSFSSLHNHSSTDHGSSIRNDPRRPVLTQTHFGNTDSIRNSSLPSRSINNRHINHSHARENASGIRRNSSHSALRKRRKRMSRSQGVVDTADESMAQRPICPREGSHRHILHHYSHRYQPIFQCINSLFWWRQYPSNHSSIPRPLTAILTSFTALISVPYYALATLVASSHADTQRAAFLAQDRSRRFPERTTGKRPDVHSNSGSTPFPRLAGIGGFISYPTTNGGSISLPLPALCGCICILGV